MGSNDGAAGFAALIIQQGGFPMLTMLLVFVIEGGGEPPSRAVVGVMASREVCELAGIGMLGPMQNASPDRRVSFVCVPSDQGV